MLVLSRKVGEQIVIGSGIRITIVAVEGDRVRLGIAAPKRTRVDRWEVHERRRLANPTTKPFKEENAPALERS
jgi:carbon storage regulator